MDGGLTPIELIQSGHPDQLRTQLGQINEGTLEAGWEKFVHAAMVTGGATDSPSVEVQTARARSSTALGEEPTLHPTLA